ncbi:MAG: DUF1501 domain-containing protein [Planctomycetaceae bacterium]
MTFLPTGISHASHAFAGLNARDREGLVFNTRRGMLKAGLAGMAGITLPALLRSRSEVVAGSPSKEPRSVILLWMAGGPSHIDMWDPKPDRPYENRGPFGVIHSKLPGVFLCEHLPKQAAMLDKFTLIRSVDARYSNHEPNKVMQTANNDAEPRLSRNGDMYPSFGSIIAKMRGPNHPSMPPYVAFMKSQSHVGFAGYLGKQYDPFIAQTACKLPIYTDVGVDTGRTTGANLFQLPRGLDQSRIHNRRSLLQEFDRLRSDVDHSGSMEALDSYGQQAVELVLGRRAQEAFDIERESAESRERYGKHLWAQQALLARRLVEAGVGFVTLDLSYHASSGTWDTHGDNIPPYGGIKSGLQPLLPIFDHLITTLVADLEERGLLESTLVIAMGEFGRTPNIGTQGSIDGRNHWPAVMSMVMAGGKYRHGQVIGATEPDGGQIAARPVTPGDLAATIYHHMQVPLDATYLDPRGRPRYIIENGAPIAEMI